MDTTTSSHLMERVVYLLNNNELTPTGNLNSLQAGQIFGFRILGDSANINNGWIFVSFIDHAMPLVFFGNLKSGANYAYHFMSEASMNGHIWICLIKARLNARQLRERLKGNFLDVSTGNNFWVTDTGGKDVSYKHFNV